MLGHAQRRMYSQIGLTLFVLSWSVATLVNTSAGQTDPRVAFILDGMLAERSKVESGRFVITGKSIEPRRDPNVRPFEGTYRVDGSIRGSKHYRFDMSREAMLASGSIQSSGAPGEPIRATISKWKRGIAKSHYFRSDSQQGFWREDAKIANLGIASEATARSAGFFDIRALGVLPHFELLTGESYQELIDRHRVSVVPKIVEKAEDGQPWIVTWEFPGDSNRRGTTLFRWTIDVDKGFTPIRIETLERLGTSALQERLVADVRLEWAQISQMWLPVFYLSSNGDDDKQNRLEVKISWTGVNEAISDEEFTFQGFKLPDHVAVVDSTLGTNLVVKSGEVLKESVIEPSANKQLRMGSRTRTTLLTTGKIVLLGSLIFIALRLFRRK